LLIKITNFVYSSGMKLLRVPSSTRDITEACVAATVSSTAPTPAVLEEKASLAATALPAIPEDKVPVVAAAPPAPVEEMVQVSAAAILPAPEAAADLLLPEVIKVELELDDFKTDCDR
jgi:hypothetical protein